MKIIHTADWHLGDSFYGFDRIAEHQHFLDWLKNLLAEERPDVLLLSGDVFDNANPSAQAEEQFYTFIDAVTATQQGIQIIITAGNHDSGRRLQAPASLLRSRGVEIRGVINHDEKGHPLTNELMVPVRAVNNPDEQAVVLAVPYIRTTDLEFGKTRSDSVRTFFGELVKTARKTYGKTMPLVLMAHLYATGSEVVTNDHSERLVVGGEDCVDVDGLDRDVSYVALGHIHKAQQVGGEDRMVFYAGSPIPMSFSEKHYHHGVNKIILGPNGGIVMEQVEYTPMRQLLSFPDRGAASLAEIMKLIKQLPSKNKEDADLWPYLEIQLQDSESGLAAQNEILNAIEDRAARLCKIVKAIPQATAERQTSARTLEQLRNRLPIDIALDAYYQATGQEMDDELIERFKAVAQSAQNQQQQPLD